MFNLNQRHRGTAKNYTWVIRQNCNFLFESPLTKLEHVWWDLSSPGMLSSINRYLTTDLSKQRICPISRARQSKIVLGCLVLTNRPVTNSPLTLRNIHWEGRSYLRHAEGWNHACYTSWWGYCMSRPEIWKILVYFYFRNEKCKMFVLVIYHLC
jgi:hypothetical protein